MNWKMRLLLMVDALRNKLLHSLAQEVILPEEDTPSSEPSISEMDYYFGDDDECMVSVPRDILADMVITIATLARDGINPELPFEILSTVAIGGSADELIHTGFLTLDNINEMAEIAEVDHVLDFLLGQELDHNPID